MRRIPGPGGLLILAAIAAPLIVTGAKPIVKKIGRGLKKFGDKMVQAVDEVEAEVKAKMADTKAEEAKVEDEAPAPEYAERTTADESPMDAMNEAANESLTEDPPKPSKPAAQRKPAAPRKPTKRPAKAAEDESTSKPPQGRKKANPNLKTG